MDFLKNAASGVTNAVSNNPGRALILIIVLLIVIIIMTAVWASEGMTSMSLQPYLSFGDTNLKQLKETLKSPYSYANDKKEEMLYEDDTNYATSMRSHGSPSEGMVNGNPRMSDSALKASAYGIS